jgi:arylesterase/paraoxonase
MANLLKWALIVAVTIVVFGSIQVFRRMEEMGQFITLEKVVPGACLVVNAPPGPEDLAADRAGGVVVLSSENRRAALAGAPVDGAIYAFDPARVETAPVLLTGPGTATPSPFHPAGISLYTDETGKRTLMVANRRNADAISVNPDDYAVEIFDVSGAGPTMTLAHRRTVTSPLFRSLNDIAAVSPDSFYATNTLGSDTAFGARLEVLLGLSRADVLWFDGASAVTAASGMGLANGIDASPDGSTVYVSETGARRLKAFQRDAATGGLTLVNDGFFGTGLDNINVAPDGALWIGAHPRLIDLYWHASDASQPSPSQVLRVEPQAGGAARTLYTDMGYEISGVSAAVELNGKIVAGALFEPKLLVCDWTATPPPPG